MAIIGIPKQGEIWKLKSNGKIWLFKSNGINRGFLTEHDGAYCLDCNGDSFFDGYISRTRGNHIGINENIDILKKANMNECAIFYREMRQ